MKALVSGSEKHDGKNIATAGDWESAVFALASCQCTLEALILSYQVYGLYLLNGQTVSRDIYRKR